MGRVVREKNRAMGKTQVRRTKHMFTTSSELTLSKSLNTFELRLLIEILKIYASLTGSLLGRHHL